MLYLMFVFENKVYLKTIVHSKTIIWYRLVIAEGGNSINFQLGI